MPDVSRDPAGLIAKALAYGIPLFEMARLAYGFSHDPGNPRRVPVNRFAHRRVLADHTHRMVTTPNNDTLYSSAVLDLSAGPVALEVPDFGNRYFSIAFIDACTNNFAYVGTRTTGGAGVSYRIAGPAWQGEAPYGARLIRAPGNHIVALVRILVDGPPDYAEVHRLQDRLKLSGTLPAPVRPDLIQPVAGDAENFVAVVNQVLRDDPPPAADTPILEELASVGIGADASPLSPEQCDLWARYFSSARSQLIAASAEVGSCIAGWQYPSPHTGNFGTDYEARAKIAIRGVTANIPAESTYALAMTDSTGAPLDERHRYRLRLSPGTPPADGFWSLSIYEIMPDGSMFFGDNELHRYAIGSRTRDLIRNPDGSLDLFIQKNRPAGAINNWLPVPARNFALIMRAYLPQPPLLNGSFRYSGIERLD
jgi:hypothetical protein